MTGGLKTPDRDLVVASVPLILGKLRRRYVYNAGDDAMATQSIRKVYSLDQP